MTDVLTLLRRLVQIPSVNPMGRSPRDETDFESRLSRFLEAHIHELGLDVERHPAAPGRDNLIVRWAPDHPARWILWDVHQDTVPADSMTVPPFEGVVDSDRLYGRGACDVKGAMAGMLVALERLSRERPAGAAGVILALTVDEEFTHRGSSALARMDLPADLAIVAEPTGFDIVTCHKGSVRFTVSTQGVACHSSAPDRGRNAIYGMSRVLTTLEEHARALAVSKSHGILGTPTLSVGRIEGGEAVNVVPDRCTIQVDRRIIPGETPASAMAEVREFLVDRLGTIEELKFVSMGVEMPPLESTASEADLGLIAEVVHEVTGRRAARVGVPYGTDAGPLSQASMPSLVLGPGDIAQAHTRDEWIEIDQVRLAAEVYFKLACDLGRHAGGH